MKKFPIEVGSLVKSMAGRDEGRLFVVVKMLDADFCEVVNGALRGVERPKKKRLKHLKPLGPISADLAARIGEGTRIEDHEIRAWIQEEEHLV